MEQLLIAAIISALVALIGKNRQIGYGWSFFLCLFVSPVIGLFFILRSKKKDIEFVDVTDETNKE